MRVATLLVLLAATAASAQPGGRLSVSGSATLHGIIGGGGVPAATAAASYRFGEGDRLGAFAFLSPEAQGVPRLAVVGGAWDILIERRPNSPYVTLGAAVAHQTELGAVAPCSPENFCFERDGLNTSRFTSRAIVLGAGPGSASDAGGLSGQTHSC